MSLNTSRMGDDDEDSLERSMMSSTRSTNGTRSLRPTRSMASLDSTAPQVDSAISDIVTLEQREKFTLYKVIVNETKSSWIIYRRYRFCAIKQEGKNLAKAFPNFRLSLPGRRIFRDNFNKDFIDRRQHGLEEFMKNVLSHRDIVQNAHVQRFFRFDNPPQPNECLEACQAYAQSLEVSLSNLRHKLRDQNAEVAGLKTEIARTKYQKPEDDQGSYEKDQKYHHMVEDAIKAIENASNDIRTLHRNGLELYRKEAEDLHSDLKRESLQSQMRIKEATELRQQLERQHVQFREAFKKQDDYIKSLNRSLRDSHHYANATEEKYFYSLVIGVKLNMASRSNRIVHINQLNPMTLFERVRNHGISIEHWPSWVSRELATASTWGEDTLA
ncbi:hypothetical protein QZH41_009859 [Actinostola sp. cb2023]|nr:hypothetical protein QZH41_009859 [Actinostola sp. cb2023]